MPTSSRRHWPGRSSAPRSWLTTSMAEARRRGLLSLPQLSSKATGWEAVGLAAVTVAGLVAGAFDERFEVIVDGAGEAETSVDTVVEETDEGGAAGEFLGALFEGVGGGFEGVTDGVSNIVVFGVDPVFGYTLNPVSGVLGMFRWLSSQRCTRS